MITPIGDRVFVRDVPPSDRRTGYLTKMREIGLVTPDTADKGDADRDVRECIVVATGPGFALDNGERAPTGLQAGDRVLVSLNATVHAFADVEGERLRVVRIWDLVAVIDDVPELNCHGEFAL